MFKKLLITAAIAGAAAASPANALSFVAQNGSAAAFAAPTVGGVSATFTFNAGAATPAGFTTTYVNAGTRTGDTPSVAAEPAFSDGSAYLAVLNNGSATLQSTTAYQYVSFFLGSIDSFNFVDVLDTAGNVIGTYNGTQLAAPNAADGNQDISQTNRRITIFRTGTDAAIGGIRFRSVGSNSFSTEVDNVVFAVPEPSTWALMLMGFGMIGLTMRSRRRRTNVVFA